MDINRLIGHVPNSVITELPNVIATFDIDSPFRLSHFLGNTSHESGGFVKVYEDANYTSEELLKQWPNHFNTENVSEYAHQPIKILNRAYANRFGNGDEASGDGWKYRGRGYIEETFRDNYRIFGQYVKHDLEANPDLVATEFPLLSAGFYWHNKKVNSIADKGMNNAVIGEVRHVVNGGIIGLDKVILKVNEFYSLLK